MELLSYPNDPNTLLGVREVAMLLVLVQNIQVMASCCEKTHGIFVTDQPLAKRETDINR
jgi:hypothetical protein